MYFNVNFNVLFKLIKVHLLMSELYIYQNVRCNDKKKPYFCFLYPPLGSFLYPENRGGKFSPNISKTLFYQCTFCRVLETPLLNSYNVKTTNISFKCFFFWWAMNKYMGR